MTTLWNSAQLRERQIMKAVILRLETPPMLSAVVAVDGLREVAISGRESQGSLFNTDYDLYTKKVILPTTT